MTPTPRTIVLLLLASLLTTANLHGQGFSPDEALRRMKVADGFQVKLAACEPMIRQPVSMTFDERGRLWVIQYLQYPNPAGLKPVKVDQYLRTVYDRLPEPPPKGPRGLDRITILDDPDAAGRYRKAKDFVTGLNLASGMTLGHGGVWVVQPPYLLFYPDRDRNDVPDGPPEVVLTGFGMEDAHAFANSLQWGPDGWLYGAQGSTVTAHIRGIEFQQGIWRYHPRTKEFELFAEGGGNTWGLDFDRHGNIIAGTNYGGMAMLHQVQGGYYVKNFGKHGALHNPHSYGYFEHVPYKGSKGGHVTCGGIVYNGGASPGAFAGRYIAGNLLSNALYWHTLEPRGSSFTSRFGGDFLVANDTWFRPVDCLGGPDGALYIADWYDRRASHLDPIDNWDRSNGRIYKVEAVGAKPSPRPMLGKMSSKELIGLLNHPNNWYSREARRLLAERRDASVVPELRRLVLEEKGQLALEGLWALYVSGGFDEEFAGRLLGHVNEDVRTWAVRLVGDAKKVAPSTRARLVEMARRESSPVVRSQLACSAKRLPAADCLPIVRELLGHAEDIGDAHIPLLLWWAVEDKAILDREGVLALVNTPEAWRQPLVRNVFIERLARRYAAEGGEADLSACARLLAGAPGEAEAALVLGGMDKALEGRRLAQVPASLREAVGRLWRAQGAGPALRLAVRLGDADAYRRAEERAGDNRVPEGERATLIALLGEVGSPSCIDVLLGILEKGPSDNLRGAALAALGGFRERRIAERVLALYPRLPGGLRGRAQALLAGRPDSALSLLEAVDAGRIAAREIPLEQVRRLAAHKDERVQKLVEKHWGRVGPATAGEKLTRIRSIAATLRAGTGDRRRGRPLFQKNCAICHTLFGEGNKIGPDLTGANRKDRDYMLMQVVDPSAVIRPEYQAFNVELKDGRTLTGLVVEAAPGAITLVDARNERTVIARSRIEQMEPSPVSLMPEKVLDALSDQELRDLFAYLEGDGPLPGK